MKEDGVTEDELIELAREAGFVWSLLAVVDKHRLKRIVELVREKERTARVNAIDKARARCKQ